MIWRSFASRSQKPGSAESSTKNNSHAYFANHIVHHFQNKNSVYKLEGGMFSAQQMLILYPIFKELIEGKRSNDSLRRSISPATFSRLGRSGKRLSHDQYVILRHEFGRDPRPSEQKEIDLASRFGVQQ